MKKFHSNPSEGSTNEILDIDEAGNAYVSFNPAPYCGIGLFKSDGGGSETALVMDEKFFILNGDHRKAYENALESGGLPACVAVFAELEPAHRSSWTSDALPEDWIEARVKNLNS